MSFKVRGAGSTKYALTRGRGLAHSVHKTHLQSSYEVFFQVQRHWRNTKHATACPATGGTRKLLPMRRHHHPSRFLSKSKAQAPRTKKVWTARSVHKTSQTLSPLRQSFSKSQTLAHRRFALQSVCGAKLTISKFFGHLYRDPPQLLIGVRGSFFHFSFFHFVLIFPFFSFFHFQFFNFSFFFLKKNLHPLQPTRPNSSHSFFSFSIFLSSPTQNETTLNMCRIESMTSQRSQESLMHDTSTQRRPCASRQAKVGRCNARARIVREGINIPRTTFHANVGLRTRVRVHF